MYIKKNKQTVYCQIAGGFRCQDSGFSMEDDTNFAEWAGALLEWNSELRMVRFQSLGARRRERRLVKMRRFMVYITIVNGGYGIYNYS